MTKKCEEAVPNPNWDFGFSNIRVKIQNQNAAGKIERNLPGEKMPCASIKKERQHGKKDSLKINPEFKQCVPKGSYIEKETRQLRKRRWMCCGNVVVYVFAVVVAFCLCPSLAATVMVAPAAPAAQAKAEAKAKVAGTLNPLPLPSQETQSSESQTQFQSSSPSPTGQATKTLPLPSQPHSDSYFEETLLEKLKKRESDSPSVEGADRPCIPRDFGRGSIVCVCNSTYCDSTTIPQKPPANRRARSRSGDQGQDRSQSQSQSQSRVRNGIENSDGDEIEDVIHIYTSSKSGLRLHKSTAAFNTNDAQPSSSKRQKEKVERGKRTIADTLSDVFGRFSRRSQLVKFRLNRKNGPEYQKLIGIGGAFTDSAGINIASLSRPAQLLLLKSYFGPTGNDYSLGRVPIGGTDFSLRPYTYDDQGKTPDTNLTNFSLQPEDLNFKIPYIKLANALSGGKLKLIASPWSAPVWMKTNNKLSGAGQLKREYYQAWADYFVRFIDEYKNEGIFVWGVTTGNEPFDGFVQGFPFNCMGWRASDMKDWISNNLGPTLKAARSDLNVRIIIFDDNKGGLPTWTKEILENNRSSMYVDGIGTHWYFDFITGANVLSRVHKKHPEYFIIQTEACLGFTPWELDKVILGSWERAEQYLEAIIRDFKNWVSGWLDWNLALDLNGGPNWAKFAADAAILVNPKDDEFFKQPIYYAIGHVSKFLPPDSVRIELSGSHVPTNLQSVAFRRPDNATVIIFFNKLNYDAKVSLFDEERGSVFLTVPAKAIQTLIYY